MTPFLSGAAQFFIPSHLLAIVALGLLGGQRAGRVPLSSLAAFAIGLVVGSLAVASAIRENPAALALLLLAAAAAGLVVVAYDVPRWLVGLLAFAAGAALPLNSPPHELTIANAVASQVGLATTAIVTFTAVSFVTRLAQTPWHRIAIRIVASWIAASAILVLTLRLVR
jgi:urease accessory protein